MLYLNEPVKIPDQNIFLDSYQRTKEIPRSFFDKISAGNHQLSLATVPINVHSKGLFVNKIREINVKNSPKLAYSASEASPSYSWSTFTPVKFDDMVALVNNIK